MSHAAEQKEISPVWSIAPDRCGTLSVSEGEEVPGPEEALEPSQCRETTSLGPGTKERDPHPFVSLCPDFHIWKMEDNTKINSL